MSKPKKKEDVRFGKFGTASFIKTNRINDFIDHLKNGKVLITDLIKNVFMAILIFCTISFTIANANVKDYGLSKLFTERAVRGTIVISSLDSKTEFVYNEERAEKRFLPASTFKIPNTLIALEEKAIASEVDIIKWDRKDKGWSPWNKMKTMR